VHCTSMLLIPLVVFFFSILPSICLVPSLVAVTVPILHLLLLILPLFAGDRSIPPSMFPIPPLFQFLSLSLILSPLPSLSSPPILRPLPPLFLPGPLPVGWC
jgi:hypothetical protein